MKYLGLLFILLVNPLFSKEYPVLVTGCGRSGTHFMTHVLKKNGLDVKHENLGKDGAVSWYRGGGNYLKFGKNNQINGKKATFKHIFHQVRNPIDTISSCQTLNANSWAYICSIVKEIELSDPLIVRCAKYWLYWNLLVEKKAEWTYRVEDSDDILDEFFDRIGRSKTTGKISKCSRSSRSHKYEKLTWEDLKENLNPDLYTEIINLTQKYGYQTPYPTLY